ncbi:hypothetical protein KKF84_20905 [Myxococcota bacterium]|nr:hypothetical protein [Myxococcota bacterium]MBU1537785.1 hypothetical protein [Myxococcota bacterium]
MKYLLLVLVFTVSACKEKKTTPDNGNGTGKGNGTVVKDPTDFTNKGNGPKGTTTGPKGSTKVVSKSMIRKFNAVLTAFYALADQGWPKDGCKKVADRFDDLLKEKGAEKVVSFVYNAGVTYFRCGMNDKAKAAFEKTLSMDGSFPGARMALLIIKAGGDAKSLLSHETEIMKDNFSLQDPDVNYNFALAYYERYKKSGGQANIKKLLGYLRRALANIGKIDNKTLEAVRVRMEVYTLSILFYMEAERRKDANIDLAKVFLAQARDYIRPCSGKLAIKDIHARHALARFHNAYGLLQLEEKNIGRAFDEFKKAIACNSDDFSANLNLGMMGIQFREPELAIKSLELIINKYGSRAQAKDAHLALAVAYKVYGMKLQDMADNQFENKERLEGKLKRAEAIQKELKKGLDILNKALSASNIRTHLKRAQPYVEQVKRRVWNTTLILKKLDKGEITVKQIKDDLKKTQAALDNSVNNYFPKAIAELSAQLTKLKDVGSLRTEAKSFFVKSKEGYEKYMGSNPNDYRVVYNLAILLYKAGDLLGDMTGNLAKARELFEKLMKMRSATKAYKEIARKHSADIKTTLVRLKENKSPKADVPKAKTPSPKVRKKRRGRR